MTRACNVGDMQRSSLLSAECGLVPAACWQELPEAVLDMMMSKNIERVLKANGLSFPSILGAR